jgi:hypothetical protein
MAISVSQQPSYPNATYTHLLYSISSTESGQPQYQYVLDIKQGGTRLARIKQYPNPNAVGIFDPARVLNDYIEYDENWKTSTLHTPVSSVQTFDILFGEEYGTSVSSSVVMYDGNGSPGDPNVAATAAEVFGGVVDPNNGSSFNWQAQPLLSNRPTIGDTLSLTRGEYETLSIYNDGSLTNATVSYNPGSTSTYTLNAGFNTIPIGGANIGTLALWNEIVVNVDSTEYTYTLADDCNYDRIRFAFINKFGFWDYYGFNLPIAKNTTMERQGMTRPMVNYSGVVAGYNAQRRGQDWYNIQYTDEVSVTTPLVDQSESEWLSEMLESPSIYVQQGDNFIPIVITDTGYLHNTNKRSQKTFQYNITFEYANNRIGR